MDEDPNDDSDRKCDQAPADERLASGMPAKVGGFLAPLSDPIRRGVSVHGCSSATEPKINLILISTTETVGQIVSIVPATLD